MARTEARFFASTWTDDADWRALHPYGKLFYQFILAQPELRHCGVITVATRLWALRIGWDQDTLHLAMKHAAEARYVVVDENTEELLVRTLIRNDGIWKQPKMLAVAVADAARVESRMLRAAILAELKRLDPRTLPEKTAMPVASLLRNLPPRIADARFDAPPSGPADPPRHGRHYGPAHPPAEGGTDAPADPPREGGADAHAQGVRGKGKGNGEYWEGPLTPVPNSPTPSHDANGWRQPPLLTPVPANVQAEGEGDDDHNPAKAGVDALGTKVQAMRREWTAASIRKALTDQRTLERPWPLVEAAAMIVYADPATITPMRLPEGGDWWTKAAAQLATLPTSRPQTVTCPAHHLDHAAAGECSSCAADRKAAS
jgi:hypothetical protein